ncbi:MAG: hypothetical protein KDM64_03330 [Verrucomicrobiae bacterium]|nr:hypothetical protein [Verrucomicrobiae bacterium]
MATSFKTFHTGTQIHLPDAHGNHLHDTVSLGNPSFCIEWQGNASEPGEKAPTQL